MPETTPQDQENANVGDQICGPKCVCYLLDYYEKPEDIVSLIRELQWPDFRRGTSLKNLADALEKRGIFTSVLQVSPYSRIVHSEPVIVHFKPESEGDLGHFAVWLPSSNIPLVFAIYKPPYRRIALSLRFSSPARQHTP